MTPAGRSFPPGVRLGNRHRRLSGGPLPARGARGMLDPEPGVPLTTMGQVARANALT